MNPEVFRATYTGKEVSNNGGGFVGECVSLASRFAQQVQGVPGADSVLYCQVTGGARDLYENPTAKLLQYYTKVPYGQPRQLYDLVVWGINKGKYGDVAIAWDTGNTVFGQLGTPVFIPAQIRVDTTAPLGYLRLKGGDMPLTPTQIDKFFKMAGQNSKSSDYTYYANKAGELADNLWGSTGNARWNLWADKPLPPPLVSGQQDKLIKAMKQAEPTAEELNNPDWANNPGLAIDALWNNYGKNHYPPLPPGTSGTKLNKGNYYVE